jgi:hypothetical protein
VAQISVPQVSVLAWTMHLQMTRELSSVFVVAHVRLTTVQGVVGRHSIILKDSTYLLLVKIKDKMTFR